MAGCVNLQGGMRVWINRGPDCNTLLMIRLRRTTALSLFHVFALSDLKERYFMAMESRFAMGKQKVYEVDQKLGKNHVGFK